MAGYSGTPLAKKLGIKEGSRVAVVGAPRSAQGAVAEMAAQGPVQMRLGAGAYDVIVVFCGSRRELEERFAAAAGRLKETGGLWIAWPKKSSGVKTDLTEDVAREMGLEAGLVDNKVCAIDEVWSGLRLVVRVKDRKGAARGGPALRIAGRRGKSA